ncbi:MAG: GntR family transcriptional regulator [Bacteroidales bacterium]|nr:GntR family transcriptional regulator [Bacteroidales bacterium]
MDFKKQKPIYLQIADSLCERILSDEWVADERVPSVRDVAGTLGVNPNTVMRTFDYLQTSQIIYNRRGVGYFVDPQAKKHILNLQKEAFVHEELPTFYHQMQLLGLTFDDLKELIKTLPTEGE